MAQGTAGTTAISTSVPVTSTSNSSADTNRSRALKIGLGVGIPVGLLCIGGLVFFGIWQRRVRRRRRSEQNGAGTQDQKEYAKPELPDEPVQVPVELDAYMVPPELVAGKGLRPELAGEQMVAELPQHGTS